MNVKYNENTDHIDVPVDSLDEQLRLHNIANSNKYKDYIYRFESLHKLLDEIPDLVKSDGKTLNVFIPGRNK